MGKEINTSPFRLKQFLGLNQRITDTAIDPREAAGLENVNITEESLRQRLGSEFLNSVAFKEKTNTTAVSITGIYETTVNGTQVRVGTGGDSFREYVSLNWTDRTGAVTITNDADIHFSFATFYDNANAEIVIAANGTDAPLKWTGSGNASALATPPGNFNFPVVHKNRLWVAVDDIVYFSDYRDGETWDTLLNLARFDHRGEDITGLYKYADQIIVFQKTAIHAISGGSNRDLFIQTIVSGEGCASGFSIQEVESRKYGNILIFLSNQGIIKGFNGSKNLLKLGDAAPDLFSSMNVGRHPQSVSMNYKKLGQYWLALTYGTGTENNQIVIYDYRNDFYTDEKGRQLSSILYHTGINANAMNIWYTNLGEIPVTGDYNGFALQQDKGLLDEEASPIRSTWLTGRFDFGAPNNVKMLSDFAIVTTQSTTTEMSITATTKNYSGISSLSIPAAGGLWGSMVWGTGLWSSPSTEYTRAEFTLSDPSLEGAIIGRYHQFQFNHSDPDEAMVVEEVIIGVTDLGYQPEYLES